MNRNLAAMLSALLLAGIVCADDLVLVREGKAETVISLEKGATAAEERGARELQQHLRDMSDAEPATVRQGDAGGLVEIHLAHDATLGPEEYRLKTGAKQLEISGGRPRGVLYGCYTLLDRLGVRWFTPTVTHVPRRATVAVPALDERGAPVFEYRHLFTFEADDPDWAARNRLNGASKRLDASYGGCVLIQPFVHSLDQIVPAGMFEAHPEYFPEIDGKRSAGIAKGGKVYPGAVQRCLSNSAVVKLAVAKLEEWVRECPEAQFISVSQNDGDGWCASARSESATLTRWRPARRPIRRTSPSG